MLMTFEATRDLPLKEVEIETPLCKAKNAHAQGEDIAIVPILQSRFRNGGRHASPWFPPKGGPHRSYQTRTPCPVEYYQASFRYRPQKSFSLWIPCWPPEVGGCVHRLHQGKGGGKDIIFMCLIAAPEGIKVLQDAHPDVNIFIAAKDSHLNGTRIHRTPAWR